MQLPPPTPVHKSAPLLWHRRPTLWWGLFALWNTALFWLSSLHGDQLPPMPFFPQLDKFEHAGFFAVGFGLFTVALGLMDTPVAGRWGRLIGLAILAGTVCGGLDELHQTFTPNRSGLDVGDWVADITGATLGALAAAWWLRAFVPREQPVLSPIPAASGRTPVDDEP